MTHRQAGNCNFFGSTDPRANRSATGRQRSWRVLGAAQDMAAGSPCCGSDPLVYEDRATWCHFRDMYQWPFVRTFSSWADLRHQLDAVSPADLRQTSAQVWRYRDRLTRRTVRSVVEGLRASTALAGGRAVT